MTTVYRNLSQQAGAILRYQLHDWWIDNAHWVHGPDGIVTTWDRPAIPEASTQAIIRPIGSIQHSNAGPHETPWWNLAAYWNRADITGEAHFQLDGVDGPVETKLFQAIPLNRRADCNYRANYFIKDGMPRGFISFETQDNGGSSLPVTPWSIGNIEQGGNQWGQIDVLVAVNTLICVTYGTYCSYPTHWQDSGIGHHSAYKEWSVYVGKTCPGEARIRQMDYLRAKVAEKLAAFSDATGWRCGMVGGV
jgi:hypothetical protein